MSSREVRLKKHVDSLVCTLNETVFRAMDDINGLRDTPCSYVDREDPLNICIGCVSPVVAGNIHLRLFARQTATARANEASAKSARSNHNRHGAARSGAGIVLSEAAALLSLPPPLPNHTTDSDARSVCSRPRRRSARVGRVSRCLSSLGLDRPDSDLAGASQVTAGECRQ